MRIPIKRGKRSAAVPATPRVDRLGGWFADSGRRISGSALGRWWTTTSQPSLVDWLLLAVVLLVAGLTFVYGDVMVTFEHSFNFLDALFSGRLRDFYQIAIDHGSYGHPAVYDVPLYFVFGMWNLPTYVIYKISGFDYLHSVPAELWLKALIVVSALLAARVLADIAHELGVGRERGKWVMFFFLSSMTVFIPVFVIVQYDIILVLVMLLGLRAYVKDDLRSFLLWFMLGNTLKLFAMFVFIPLLLLREKRLRHVFWQLAVGLLGLVACRLLFHGNVAYKASTGGFTDSMLSRLVATGIPWQNAQAMSVVHTIPFFVVFMVGLAVFAYARNPLDFRDRGATGIYVCLAAYLAFISLVPLNPYWMVLVSPFAVLVIFLNPRYFLLNTVLETAIGSSLFFIYVLVGFQIYNSDIFSRLLLPRLVVGPETPRYANGYEVLRAAGLDRGLSFVIGFMIACTIAVLVLNYPSRSFAMGMPNRERISRALVWSRLLPLVLFLAMLFALYAVPAKPVAYSTTTDSPSLGSVDILQDGALVKETLRLSRTTNVYSIGVGIDASRVQWIDSAVVRISITSSSGGVLFTGEQPANGIGAGLAVFDTPGLVLEGGAQYDVVVSSAQGELDPAWVQLNQMVDVNTTTENGVVVPGDLVLQIWGAEK